MKQLFLLVTLFCGFLIYSQDENPKLIKTDSTERVEKVPIYEGCDESLSISELKKCMSEAINKLVSENFNKSLAYTLNLPEGTVRIMVQFKVDTIGDIVGIRAKAPHPFLEKEAIRVIKLIPRLTPGFQRGKVVTVPYGFPIKFEIEDNKPKIKKSAPKKQIVNADKLDKYPVYKGCKEDLEFLMLKQCTSRKISNFIQMSFDLELAERLFPLEQSTKFLVEFIIDENGRAKNINVKAHKREIAVEAIKVVKRLPKFKKPGYSNGKPVAVPYKFIMTIYFL